MRKRLALKWIFSSETEGMCRHRSPSSTTPILFFFAEPDLPPSSPVPTVCARADRVDINLYLHQIAVL